MESSTKPTTESKDLENRTLQFQWIAAHSLINVSPSVSRNIMLSFHQSKKAVNKDYTQTHAQYCPQCGNAFFSGNHSASFTAKKMPDKKTKKALRRFMQKRGSVLAPDKALVDRYKKAKSMLKLHCKNCKFTQNLPCATRESVVASRQKTTNARSEFDLPQSQFLCTKTVHRTSTPKIEKKPLSKSQKKKRSSTSRLSDMLKNSSNSSINNSLQDFLSSL